MEDNQVIEAKDVNLVFETGDGPVVALKGNIDHK